VTRAALLTLTSFLALATVTPDARAEVFTRRSFTLPAGSVELTGMPARPSMLALDISDDGDFEPFHAPLHVYFGAVKDLTLGITHEVGPFYGYGGPCFNCDTVYNDVGFSLLWNLVRMDGFELELSIAAPEFLQFRPEVHAAFRGGVLGRVNAGDVVAIVFDPSLQIGLTGRPNDQRPGIGNNKDFLWLPVWFYFQVTPGVAPFVGTGFGGRVEGFFSHMEMPLELGCIASPGQNVDVGGMLQFNNVFGDGGSFDWRQIAFLGRFRFN
jgi:hypothetical protein